jgi:hypothetical protein
VENKADFARKTDRPDYNPTHRRRQPMQPTDFAKQIVDYQKVTFNSTFNTLARLQDQTENLTANFLEKTLGLPKESREAYSQWVSACKKGREEIKNTIDKNFSTIEGFFAPVKTAAEKS